jgi:hypothetical protein
MMERLSADVVPRHLFSPDTQSSGHNLLEEYAFCGTGYFTKRKLNGLLLLTFVA